MSVQRMEMPYKHLIAKKNNNSKPHFMLAELVDNSISSWKTNGSKGDLNIEIIIDEVENVIIVEDDAFGMSREKLSESIKLNKESEGNNLNMFGVGMKNAAFWFAEDLTIKTNDGNESSETLVHTSKVEDKNSTIEWDTVESDWPNRGTIVTLSNVYKDKRLSKEDFETVAKIFEIKYANFIKNGINKKGININMKRYMKNGGEQNIKLKEVKIIAQTIPLDKKEKFLEQLDKAFENGVPLKYIKNLKEIVTKLINDEKQLKFKVKIPFSHEGKRKNIDFLFGIQDESNKKNENGFKMYYGLTTLQDNRAINMPPDSALDLSRDYIRTNGKRLFGFAELGHLFRPDNNKQEFNFGEYKSDFLGMLKEIGSELEIVADVVQDVVGVRTKSNKGQTKASANKIQNAIAAKSPLIWDVSTEGSNVTLKVDDGRELQIKIIEVSIEDVESKEYFINAEKIDDGNLEIKFNINHPIWKPLSGETGNNIDTKIVTYPLVAIIGVSSISIKEKVISDILGTDFDANDMLSILNYISKVMIN